jgi:hypothetical protein
LEKKKTREKAIVSSLKLPTGEKESEIIRVFATRGQNVDWVRAVMERRFNVRDSRILTEGANRRMLDESPEGKRFRVHGRIRDGAPRTSTHFIK